MKCAVTDNPYVVFGYGGKQVRDNIHSFDLVNAFWHFLRAPRSGEVYNIGGGRYCNCSMLEAIDKWQQSVSQAWPCSEPLPSSTRLQTNQDSRLDLRSTDGPRPVDRFCASTPHRLLRRAVVTANLKA